MKIKRDFLGIFFGFIFLVAIFLVACSYNCDHNYGDWNIENEATCILKGSEYRICSKCGKKETKVLEALGHDYSEWKITKPSCTAPGKRERKCNRCGNGETVYIQPLKHKYKYVQCAQRGIYKKHYKYCERCHEGIDEVTKDFYENSKEDCTLGEDGCCKFCHGGNYELNISNDGVVNSMTIENNGSINLVIPDYITVNQQNINVTKIADQAFSAVNIQNMQIKSVIIGKNVTSIGDRAFFSCKNIETIILGDSLKSIGEEAFANLRYNEQRLSYIKIPKSVETISRDAFTSNDSCEFEKIEFESNSNWKVHDGTALDRIDYQELKDPLSAVAEYTRFHLYTWERIIS